jgi:hypothetical protein
MVLYLVWAILPWVSLGFFFSLSGFSYSGLVTFSFVLLLLAAVWAVLPAFTDLKLGFPRGWITVGLAGLAVVLTLIAWINSLNDAGFSIWPLLALLTAVAVTVFAVLGVLPELRNRPTLPGALGGAAQWANQPGPGLGQQFGGQGGPGGRPGPQQGQPGPAQGAPYGGQQQYAPPPPPPPAGHGLTPPPPPPSYGGSSAPGGGSSAPAGGASASGHGTAEGEPRPGSPG